MALRTPLYDWHVSKGATVVEFAGWDMPVRYGAIADEHNATRTACGLFDVSHMGRLSLGGPDALALIQHAWTNDAASMKVNQVRYGLVCNEQGGILDDVLVYRWPDFWSLVVNASNRDKILAHLGRLAGGRNVTVKDCTAGGALLAVQGPAAIGSCKDMFDADIGALKYYHATPAHCQGQPCMVSRTGYTGEDGFEVGVAGGVAAALADELVRRGARPCGLAARDTLRLEAAMPLYGHELTEDTDPLQAGLAWAVKLDKGDFVGREAILSRKDTPRPLRVGLELEGKRAAREGAKVSSGDRAVGKVTSGTVTPTLDKAVAMAYVDPEQSAIGTALSVAVGRSELPARVVALPFYRRAGK